MCKICEHCGNQIPERSSACPSCGKNLYDDMSLQNILDELGIALKSDSETSSSNGSSEDLQVQLLNALESMNYTTNKEQVRDQQRNIHKDINQNKKQNTPNSNKRTTSDEKLQSEILIALEHVDQMDHQTSAEGLSHDTPSEANAETDKEALESDITMIFDTAKVDAVAQRQRDVKSKPVVKTTGAAHKTSSKKRSSRNQVNSMRGSKKQKSSAALVGVLVGVLVALLIVAGGAAYILYQMGFFTTLSDEELLGISTTVTTEADSEVSIEEPASEIEILPEDDAEAFAEEIGDSEEIEDIEELEEESIEDEEVTTVEVNKFKVTGASTITLYSRGETSSVVYVIEPSAVESEIEWSSSDETVASVTSTGTIIARRGGNCTITGAVGDVFISVSVVCQFEVPDNLLDMNNEDITMSYERQTATLYIDSELTEEQESAIVWESSDTSVATVDDEGVVTAIANGTAVITATTGDYYASCIVRCVGVTGNTGYNSDASEYVINYEDVTLSRKGEYFQLKLSSILGNEVPEFTWESSDTSIATVDDDGIVTAVSNGTAYVTTTIGEYRFRCIVRVRIS